MQQEQTSEKDPLVRLKEALAASTKSVGVVFKCALGCIGAGLLAWFAFHLEVLSIICFALGFGSLFGIAFIGAVQQPRIEPLYWDFFNSSPEVVDLRRFARDIRSRYAFLKELLPRWIAQGKVNGTFDVSSGTFFPARLSRPAKPPFNSP